jgi:carbohydrate-binding DOMON domain-containing protein
MYNVHASVSFAPYPYCSATPYVPAIDRPSTPKHDRPVYQSNPTTSIPSTTSACPPNQSIIDTHTHTYTHTDRRIPPQTTTQHKNNKSFVVYAGVRKEADAERLKSLGVPTLVPVILDVTSEASVNRWVCISFFVCFSGCACVPGIERGKLSLDKYTIGVTSTHTRTHTHMHAHTHTRTHARTHVHTHARTYSAYDAINADATQRGIPVTAVVNNAGIFKVCAWP